MILSNQRIRRKKREKREKKKEKKKRGKARKWKDSLIPIWRKNRVDNAKQLTSPILENAIL